MGPEDLKMLRETYRLTYENNQLLRKMRRAAFWRSLVSWLVYAALFIAPVWFYFAYLNSAVENLLQSYNRIGGGSAQTPSQYESFRQALDQFQTKLQNFGGASSSSSASSSQ